MRIVIEIGNDRDASLLISLVKRLKGRILEEGKSFFTIKNQKVENPIIFLENISKSGGIDLKQDPSDWQREIRKDRNLLDRSS
jgi:hypothetical protein